MTKVENRYKAFFDQLAYVQKWTSSSNEGDNDEQTAECLNAEKVASRILLCQCRILLWTFIFIYLTKKYSIVTHFVSMPQIKAVGETRDRWTEAWIEGEASASTRLFLWFMFEPEIDEGFQISHKLGLDLAE